MMTALVPYDGELRVPDIGFRPMPPDIQYYFDGACELGDITADVWAWGRHFCPNPAELIDGLDRDPKVIDTSNNRWDMVRRGERVTDHYLNWYADARAEHKAFCTAYGIMSAEHHYREMLKYFVECTVYTKNLSGDWIECRDGSKTIYENDFYVVKDFRSVDELRNIRKRMEAIRRMVNRWNALTEGVFISHVRATYLEQQSIIYQGRVRKLPVEIKRDKRKHRKALVKSVNFLEQLLPRQNVRMFLTGQEIQIEGRLANYRIQKHWSGGHGSTSTAVYSKEGERICHLCVYVPNVPVADFVSSLILHIQAGEEDTFLKEANIAEWFIGDRQCGIEALDAQRLARQQNLQQWLDDDAECGTSKRLFGARKEMPQNLKLQFEKTKKQVQRRITNWLYAEGVILPVPRVTVNW